MKRPGYLALMNALRPRPPFQILIVMEQSPLGRSLDEVPYALKRDSAADKFMIHAIAFVDDMTREQSRERTRDALRRKAERGHVAGGRVYGYRNVRMNGHVERAIVPEEAEVLRRIFREIAAGRGYVRIARYLNADGVPAPWRRAWVAASIRAMVFRDLYRGQLVWGRTRWVDAGGTKRKVDVTDLAAWVTVPVPLLRIIDEPLWQAAHARLRRPRGLSVSQ
jgi:DNA invertase Pin-like site-specific DNA recombinase